LCCASVGAPHSKSPPDGNNSRIPYSGGSLPHKHNFLKFKHENVIKMKNKPAPALLRPSNLYNEIKKRVSKSRETIPLKDLWTGVMIGSSSSNIAADMAVVQYL
jgi:hypothetical protein